MEYVPITTQAHSPILSYRNFRYAYDSLSIRIKAILKILMSFQNHFKLLKVIGLNCGESTNMYTW